MLVAYLVALRCTLPLAMRRLPMPRLFALIMPRGTSTTRARADAAIAQSEAIARRLRAPDTCLYRALVRWTALRRAGVAAQFHMGVRRDAPETGHAWVEIAGVPVGEPADPRLVTTFRYP